MPRRSLASAALSCAADAFRSLASAAHSCARHLSATAGDVSIALPKFLVTTVAPKPQPNADGKFVFNSKDKESTSNLPVFLVDVKYEDKGEWKDAIPAEWEFINKGIPDKGKGKKWTEDKGEGDFSGTVVTQAESL